MYQMLDVGSGNQPIGTINLDVNRSYFGVYNDLDILASGTQLPFRDNSFLVVCARHLIEHMDSPVHLLEEMTRVSKKYVFISCPNPQNWRVWLFDVLSEDHIQEGFTEASLRKLFYSVNLSPVSVRFTSYNWRRLDMVLNIFARYNCREIQILGKKIS